MLELKNYSVFSKENDQKILMDIDLTLESNQCTAIIGPNGSGKSTLVHSIMGNPNYYATGSIKVDQTDLENLMPNQRSDLGLFMTFQSPPEILGLGLYSLLRELRKDHKEIHNLIVENTLKLKMSKDWLNKNLNANASGGERKRNELLQMLIANKPYNLLDEIDSGVDADLINLISDILVDYKSNKSILLVSHNLGFVEKIKPDHVIVLKSGRIVAQDNFTILAKVEQYGYKQF